MHFLLSHDVINQGALVLAGANFASTMIHRYTALEVTTALPAHYALAGGASGSA